MVSENGCLDILENIKKKAKTINYRVWRTTHMLH
jgi:hypothetical protein